LSCGRHGVCPDRFRTPSKTPATSDRRQSAAELLARIRADLATIDLVVLDLRLPHGARRRSRGSIRKLDEGKLPVRSSAHDREREKCASSPRSASPLRERVQRGAAHLPSLAPHLFPDNFNRRGSRASARIRSVPLRQHDRPPRSR